MLTEEKNEYTTTFLFFHFWTTCLIYMPHNSQLHPFCNIFLIFINAVQLETSLWDSNIFSTETDDVRKEKALAAWAGNGADLKS